MSHFTRTDDTQLGPLRDGTPLSQNASDHDAQNGQPLLQQYNTEHEDTSGTDHLTPTLTASPDDLTPTLNDDQRLPLHDKSDCLLDTTSAQDMARQLTSCRRATAPPTIRQAVLDMCITAASIYFVAFAFMAISQNGKSAASYKATHLLEAARLGPTIWPIMFSAIIGRFLTSIAVWRLERGVDVASVEYLLGSRTVFGVISTPLRLQFLHYALPLLAILWTLSPLGGQASLRVISSGPKYSNVTYTVSYLDSLLPFRMRAGENSTISLTVSAIFIGALMVPKSSKEASQDIYGNLKIPLLEEVQKQPRQLDANGWYAIKANLPPTYSSLIGLPVTGILEVGKTFLAVESSYLFPNCTLSKMDTGGIDPLISDTWRKFRKDNCNNGGYLAMNMSVLDASVNMNGPRTIVFGSLGTMATCVTTTTYVETRFTCDRRLCEPTMMRESRVKHNPTAATFLDAYPEAAQVFCSSFINSTGLTYSSTYNSSTDTFTESFDYSPLELYLSNTDNPIAHPREIPQYADLGDAVFSQRFAQLINTYYLALVAPFSVTGNFTVETNRFSTLATGGHPVARNATAQLQTTETVLLCNTIWLVILLVGSLVMLTAGLATTTLNLIRKGPEILDSFSSMLRDSPHAHVETGPSTEDGSDKARRLQETRVMLGDVCPLGTTGFVALATQTDGDGIDHVRRLRVDRVYR